jgi:hypothetical protein
MPCLRAPTSADTTSGSSHLSRGLGTPGGRPAGSGGACSPPGGIRSRPVCTVPVRAGLSHRLSHTTAVRSAVAHVPGGARLEVRPPVVALRGRDDEPCGSRWRDANLQSKRVVAHRRPPRSARWTAGATPGRRDRSRLDGSLTCLMPPARAEGAAGGRRSLSSRRPRRPREARGSSRPRPRSGRRRQTPRASTDTAGTSSSWCADGRRRTDGRPRPRDRGRRDHRADAGLRAPSRTQVRARAVGSMRVLVLQDAIGGAGGRAAAAAGPPTGRRTRSSRRRRRRRS